MGIFPGTVQPSHIRAGATIHISNPEKRRHVRTIFGDSGDTSGMMRGRSRSVSVCVAGGNRQSDQVSDHMSNLTRPERNVQIRRRQSVILTPTKHAALHALVVANSCVVKYRDRNKVCTFSFSGFSVSQCILIISH